MDNLEEIKNTELYLRGKELCGIDYEKEFSIFTNIVDQSSGLWNSKTL